MVDHNEFVVSVTEVIPGLWLGNQAASQSEKFVRSNRIGLIINATKHIPCRFRGRGPMYVRVPVNDHGFVGPDQNVEIMKKYLPELMRLIIRARRRGIPILVHCHAGAQRSAIIVAAYLLYRGHVGSVSEAVEKLVKARPIAFFGGKSVNFLGAIMGIPCARAGR
jgi:Dual specificity phosphatase, catalytic domain